MTACKIASPTAPQALADESRYIYSAGYLCYQLYTLHSVSILIVNMCSQKDLPLELLLQLGQGVLVGA